MNFLNPLNLNEMNDLNMEFGKCPKHPNQSMLNCTECQIENIENLPINKYTAMKTLIEQIEALRKVDVECLNGFSYSNTDWNMAINKVINLLQSYPVIHAKALRKKGTNSIYFMPIDNDEFIESRLPIPISDIDYRAYLKNNLLPPDAELVDLTIIVNQKGK